MAVYQPNANITHDGYVPMNSSGNPSSSTYPSNATYENTKLQPKYAGHRAGENGTYLNSSEGRIPDATSHTNENTDARPMGIIIDTPNRTGPSSTQCKSWPPATCRPPPYSKEGDTVALLHGTAIRLSSRPSESSSGGSSNNTDSPLVRKDSFTYPAVDTHRRELVVKPWHLVVCVLCVAIVIVGAALSVIRFLRIEDDISTTKSTRDITKNLDISVQTFTAQLLSTTQSLPQSLPSEPRDGSINAVHNLNVVANLITSSATTTKTLIANATTPTTTTQTVGKPNIQEYPYSTVCMIQKTCPNRPGDLHITCPYRGDVGGIPTMEGGERRIILLSCLGSKGFATGLDPRSVCRLCKMDEVNNCLGEIPSQVRPNILMKDCN